jgi:glycosyltransferase involved in cell wall biosynthesis
MTVGISLLTLVPGLVGGSETYARELTRALQRVGELEYRVFVPSVAPDAGDGLPSTPINEYRASMTIPGRILAMAHAATRPRRLLRALRLDALDAIHFPLSVMLPPVDRPAAATTVHDLQHELHPRFFSRAELGYRRAAYGWTIRRSMIVIAVSEHARETLIERLGVPAERVRTIPHGIDHERFTQGERDREAFLLYPANRWRHKNHDRLFEAFALLRRERPELGLVLTGHGHEGKPAPDGVEVRGFVSRDKLVDLYRRAAAVVFPSLYEGFGQPPLEAMACGCPVAVSNTTSLPEVCGDAAEYFDPESPEDIAAATVRALTGARVEQGLARARLFTWDGCARRHETVYRELAAHE